MAIGRWKRWVGAGVVGAALTVGGLAIGASAASHSPTPSVGSNGPALPSDPSEIGPLFGVVHGDLHLQRYEGSTIDLVLDRGRITSRTATSITFVRLDGQRATVEVGPRTIVRVGLRPSRATALRVGDRAAFVSRAQDDGSLGAVLIRSVGRVGLRR